MQKKFEINRTKIKGGCQSGQKVVTHSSKSDLPLVGRKKYIQANGLPKLTTDWNDVRIQSVSQSPQASHSNLERTRTFQLWSPIYSH